MHKFVSIYLPSFPRTIAYMLQSTEYEAGAYIKWLLRTSDFSDIAKRRTLDETPIAKAFVGFISIGIAIQALAAAMLCIAAYVASNTQLALASVVLLVTAPIAWAYLVVVPMLIAKRFIIAPKLERQRLETKRILEQHPGIKIAVAGSYGKTTMKELLVTVLAGGKKVAGTVGNQNVLTAHYDFARKLQGDEDVLVIELGEGKPGDVESFAETIQPDIAVITGIAPAHLDHYASLEQAAADIFSIGEAPSVKRVYVNGESEQASAFVSKNHLVFSREGVDDWRVSGAKVEIGGTHFKLTKDKKTMRIKSGLLGEHLIGVLATTATIAEHIGLSLKQIEAGFANTAPFEHRMQPYRLGSAWVIDDSYNGTIEGIKAGTQLLKSLKASRKLYVTPGLVDQGKDTQAIHHRMGELIAASKPDIVVLMKNSVTDSITAGLSTNGFSGKLIIQSDPLGFYQNLDQFVAHGDVVMLQNDWTDNYH